MTHKLQTLAVFQGCSTRQIRKIDELSTQLNFPAGRTITRNAHAGQQVIMVCDGTVVVERDGEHIATAGAGEVIASVDALGSAQRGAVSLHALTACELRVFSHEEFVGLEVDMPAVGDRIRRASNRATGPVPAAVQRPQLQSPEVAAKTTLTNAQ